MKFTLLPDDTDQPPVTVERVDEFVCITVGDMTCDTTPREAQQLAGAVLRAVHDGPCTGIFTLGKNDSIELTT